MQKLGGKFNSFVVLTKGNLLEWNSSNLEVIPNPLGFFTKSKSTSKRKRVIAVGTHSHNKGFDLLLIAWKRVIESFPDWELFIFGKYDRDETFLKLARALQIEDSVCFSSPVVSIEEEYLKSSILVFPSRSEGFGMVLIEAMSCGLPCVAFDCPHGPADIISNGVDGILVPAEDYQALATSLQSLMGDEKLRITMGNAARQNVVKYLPENVLPIWDELFKSIAV
jgi:glycosyltransferase involved in cell wall biosynthesis